MRSYVKWFGGDDSKLNHNSFLALERNQGPPPEQSSITFPSSPMSPAQANEVVSNTVQGQSLHVPPPPPSPTSRHLPLPLQVPPAAEGDFGMPPPPSLSFTNVREIMGAFVAAASPNDSSLNKE